MSDSNRVSVRLVAESTYGVTPTTPTMVDTAFKSFSMSPTKETTPSTTIRADRQNAGTTLLGIAPKGELTVNLVEDNSTHIAAALESAFVASSVGGSTSAAATIAADVITLTAVGGTISFASLDDYAIVKGSSLVKVTGAANALNNKTYTVISRNDTTGTLTVSPAPAANDNSGTTTALKLSVNTVSNGVTPQSFTAEKAHLDTGAYESVTGLLFSGMEIDIKAKSIIELKLPAIGQQWAVGTATIAHTVTPATPRSDTSAAYTVGNLYVGGVAKITGLTALNVKVNNNLRERPVIGSLYTDSIGHGRCDVDIKGTAYYKDTNLMALLIPDTIGDLLAVVPLSSGKTLAIRVPSLKTTSAETPATAVNTDVFCNFAGVGQIDAVRGVTISIDLI